MILRQLFDAETWTYTYLVGDPVTGKAALIDAVDDQIDRDLNLISELGLELTHVFDTHVHADHITAAGLIRSRTGAEVVGSPHGASCADRKVKHGEVVRVGELEVKVLETPGHTDDSLSFVVGDNVFTGDALFIRGTGRTDFQNGDPSQLFASMTGVLFELDDATTMWPGHDYRGLTSSTIAEEKLHNPRVAGKSREQFVAQMNALDLPAPKKLATAVPANRACGERTASV